MNDLPPATTAEEAIPLITRLAADQGIDPKHFDLRTLRLWRTKKQITVEGRKVSRRNLLEVVFILRRRGEGLTQLAASSEALAMTEEQLEQAIAAPAATPLVSSTHAGLSGKQTLTRLAQGILDQFQAVEGGAVVAYNDVLVPETITPTRLQQAQAFLGRHYFEEGQEDTSSSLHILLTQCTTPLKNWAPQALLTDVNRDFVLINGFYKIPSAECRDLAEDGRGYSLLDFRQHDLHQELREAVEKYGLQRDEKYTQIREFIGRNPLATRATFGELRDTALRSDTIEWIESLYEPAHASLANQDRLVASCSRCHSLLMPDGTCTLEGCMEQYRDRHALALYPLNEVLLARPEVRKYWCDPAREELRLFDALNKGKLKGKVQLYPQSDICDVGVEHIAIDVKEHRDPVNLARMLNDHRSDLALYDLAILAISDRYWTKHYGERLTEKLDAANHRKWRVMSVSDAIRFVRGEVSENA